MCVCIIELSKAALPPISRSRLLARALYLACMPKTGFFRKFHYAIFNMFGRTYYIIVMCMRLCVCVCVRIYKYRVINRACSPSFYNLIMHLYKL